MKLVDVYFLRIEYKYIHILPLLIFLLGYVIGYNRTMYGTLHVRYD